MNDQEEKYWGLIEYRIAIELEKPDKENQILYFDILSNPDQITKLTDYIPGKEKIIRNVKKITIEKLGKGYIEPLTLERLVEDYKIK